MVNLVEIKEFVQKTTEAMGHSLEIDSAVVDVNLVRIAGTLSPEFMISKDGIIKKVIETGEKYIVEHPREDIRCEKCPNREECNEKAFIHCPIFYKGKVIGVMGLMCFDDVQREKLVRKRSL